MASEDPGARSAYRGAVSRDVHLLAIFRGVSFLGDSLALVALYLRVAPLGHAWAIAALAVASSLPLVLLTPVAGLVVDRVRAKPLLVSLGVVEALICSGLGYWHSIASAIFLLFALNVVVAFSMPGYSALVATITGTEYFTRAQGALQGAQGVASILGPILGGLLVGATGQSWPLYIDAISFASCALGTLFIKHERRPDPATRRGAKEDMMAGILLIGRDSLLRPVLVNVFIFLLALGTVNVAEVFYVTVTFHGTALAYGLIGASFGLGTIGGSLFASRLEHGQVKMTRSLTLAVVLVGALMTTIGFVANVAQIYPFMTLIGIAVGVANVTANSLFAVRSPEHLRGRVFAALSAALTTAEIGATVVGGAVLSVIAPRTVFRLGGGIATLTAVIFGVLAIRASRETFELEAQGD
ncbi:MAG TPA: MFS transporter [Acidimicrobiales bacterium]|nr:MFS transporter [Acidimicrobiales bacterium]